MRYIPTVIEKSSHGERAYDLYSRLLKDRIVMLTTEVTDEVSSNIVAQMLFLNTQNKDPINFYINSPGGSVTAGMAIYDTMQYINSPVSTICMGQACSMGALLLCAGEHGMRYTLPNSRIMIHQPLGGTQGQVTDMEIAVKESIRIKEMTTRIIAKHTKKSIQAILTDCERDYFMNAKQARRYNLVDSIITKKANDEKT
jgi:ATP-dependent Clp protease protease subunit